MLNHMIVKTIEKIKRTSFHGNKGAKDRSIADTLQHEESFKGQRKN
jgi:hypothetical protein